MNSNELSHYGVKGMKWGVRKAQVKAAISNKSNQRKALKVLSVAAVGVGGVAAGHILSKHGNLRRSEAMMAQRTMNLEDEIRLSVSKALLGMPNSGMQSSMADYAIRDAVRRQNRRDQRA